MNNQTNQNPSIDPVRQASDLSNAFVREAKAASMGISLSQYERLLRQIGVNYNP
ncbi:hypothetical protein [Prochlorococcus sp. MIT 1300]|uniref:hypothetical protein n=1 Tax=Prochlorococcus sp. MIT 1300 TaxID=3096218 RepID=UPI002A74755C|nr:hypothetical protein [Prochlorococcus sp. MIT 1300]